MRTALIGLLPALWLAAAMVRGEEPPRTPRKPPAELTRALGRTTTHDFPPGMLFVHPAEWKVTQHPTSGGMSLAPPTAGPMAAPAFTCLLTVAEAPRAQGVLSESFVRTVENDMAPVKLTARQTVAPHTSTVGEHTIGWMRWEQPGPAAMRATWTVYTLLDGKRRLTVTLNCWQNVLPRTEKRLLGVLASVRMVAPSLDRKLVGKWRGEPDEFSDETDPVSVCEFRESGTFALFEAVAADGVHGPAPGASRQTGRWCARDGKYWVTSRQARGVWTYVGTYAITGERTNRTLTVRYSTGQEAVLKQVR